MSTILVTGSAGFIGFHVALRLLAEGHTVVGIDSGAEEPKLARVDRLDRYPRYHHFICNLLDETTVKHIVNHFDPQVVIHLAALGGVRRSMEDPQPYMDNNVVGTFNLLNTLRERVNLQHLLMASTSSAYGTNQPPFRETDRCDEQLSFYAATKKMTETMSHSFSHMYGLPTTTFRFFTVYGPENRPDMALSKFARAITNDEPIDVYNHGEMTRDFTFIDDLVTAIIKLIDKPPSLDDTDTLHSTIAPWRIVNIGSETPIPLNRYIEELEKALGKTAKKNYLDMQPGDMKDTQSSTRLLKRLIDYTPDTDISDGIGQFVDWFKRQST